MRKISIMVLFTFMIMMMQMPQVSAQEDVADGMQLHMEFYPMRDNGDIDIIVCVSNVKRSLPVGFDGYYSLDIGISFPPEHFKLSTQQDGNLIGRKSTYVTRSDSDLMAMELENGIYMTFLDMSLGNRLIDRDGVIASFTVRSLSPTSFYQSDAYYPIRFVPTLVSGKVYSNRGHEGEYSRNMSNVRAIDGMINGNGIRLGVPPLEYKAQSEIEIKPEEGSIIVDGEEVAIDVAPVMTLAEDEEARLLPFRHMAEAQGMEVNWNQDTGTATATKYLIIDGREKGISRTVILDLTNNRAYINSQEIRHDLPLMLEQDRIYASELLIRQTLGMEVFQLSIND